MSFKKMHQERGLNLQPQDHEPSTLPLSYAYLFWETSQMHAFECNSAGTKYYWSKDLKKAPY